MTQDYTDINEWHQIAEKLAEQNRLICTNGSHWEYFPGFAKVVRRWGEQDFIRIKSNKDPEYPWRLVNVSRQESVDARLLSAQ
ncbi:MAG: hypothetical protein DSZ33_05425 [Gammaproteobacteria bacterium]|nr:MAG: hypothetical protein DSZ33_05425 [Gammaproteobacteria bacterium]